VTSPNVHQLLLTRFNIRTAGVGYTEEQSPRWLEERFELFEQYCLPSVAAQTQEDFDWVIFCDEHTAPHDLDRLRSLDPRIRIALFVYKGTNPTLLARRDAEDRPKNGAGQGLPVLSTLQVYPHVRSDADVVVATRLDNDDALSRHALKRARDHVDHFLETGHDRWLYNPMLGYKLHHQTRRVFPASKHNSAFLTMFERTTAEGRARGPYAGNHSRLHEQYPTYQDESARLWLMVVHGGNVMNGIGARDTEVPIEALGDDFAISLELGAT
jgi:hypothetical protein